MIWPNEVNTQVTSKEYSARKLFVMTVERRLRDT